MTLERWLVLARDTSMWVGGLVGIGYQQATGQVSGELLLVYLAMLGVPGVLGLVTLRPGGDAGGQSQRSVSLVRSSPRRGSRPPSAG